jgi:hypothetical protein
MLGEFCGPSITNFGAGAVMQRRQNVVNQPGKLSTWLELVSHLKSFGNGF